MRDVDGSNIQSLPLIDSLRTLKLGKNLMEDESAIYLLTHLCSSHNKMEYLDLRRNSLTDKVIRPLCELLRVSKTIAFLDLEENIITDEGVTDLVEGLIGNHTLKHLKLAKNNFGTKGIKCLSSGYLTRKKSLSSLSLLVRCDEDVSHLCDGLKENESLVEFTFQSYKSHLTSLTFSNLARVLKEHKKLVKLNFLGQGFNEHAISVFNLQLQFLEKSVSFIY